MNFRSILEQDRKNVFYNTNEFAESVCLTIGEREIRVTAVKDYGGMSVQRVSGRSYVPSMSRYDLTIYVTLDQLGMVPRSGCSVYVDGERYTVRQVERHDGDLVLKLEGISE